MELFLGIVCVVIAIGLYNYFATKKKRKSLLEKYNNNIELVDRIMGRKIWQGQTEGQLIDSLGKPLDIDQKVLKTKMKEIWKYNKIAKNRFGLKVILENSEVVGWEQK